ncbi:MAG: ATP synthase F0 subunit B [Oscillospiraceae bacterium]|jgi:F-type H+-transporting ATPase subunit b|nr:ATP synthase F0 subunit B [Oscillospiraceae bacterium]
MAMEGLDLHAEDILLHILNMIILFVMLRQLLYKPVRRFMQVRSAHLKESLDEAAQAQAQAKELRAEYEGRIAAAEDVARERALEITSAANDSAKRMTESAAAESATLLAKAQSAAKAERDGALQGLQGEVAELAIGIAEQILRREVRYADSAAIAQRFFEAQGGGDV